MQKPEIWYISGFFEPHGSGGITRLYNFSEFYTNLHRRLDTKILVLSKLNYRRRIFCLDGH